MIGGNMENMNNLSEEELRKIAKEEISKSIMDNLDSALIFTYITNLEKENAELKEDNSKLILGKFREVADKNSYIKDMYISKEKIKEVLGNKDMPDEMILTYIETLVSENARLEDIEDRKIQIEYNNVFNKGVKSVEDKIKEALDYIEENSFEDTTGVVLNLQDESYWKLWKILKGE